MDIVLTKGNAVDATKGFNMNNEQNLVIEMGEAAIAIVNGNGVLSSALNILREKYKDYTFRTGGKRLVAIPNDINKKFVIKSSRSPGNQGCRDNISEALFGNEIIAQNRRGSAPEPIALFKYKGMDAAILVETKFREVYSLAQNGVFGMGDNVIRKAFLDIVAIPNYDYFVKLRMWFSSMAVITDTSLDVAFANYGQDLVSGNMGCLDAGSFILLNGKKVKCKVCGGEMIFTPAPLSVLKQVSDAGGELISSVKDKYVCCNDSSHIQSTEDIYALAYNAFYNNNQNAQATFVHPNQLVIKQNNNQGNNNQNEQLNPNDFVKKQLNGENVYISKGNRVINGITVWLVLNTQGKKIGYVDGNGRRYPL